MKNIHLISTNKPSRLWINNLLQGKLELSKESLPFNTSQNICITSNEEIKDGNYYITPNNTILKALGSMVINVEDYKKVILTTDQDLIKDGIQGIDDEFLEWFLKNPSCEKVEIKEEDYSQKCGECGETVKRGYSCIKGCFMKSGNFIPTDKNIKYKIIIPKEEQKQHLIDMMKGDEELGLYHYFEKKYSDNDLYNILLDFVEFKHDYNEARGSIINRFIKQLNDNYGK